MEISHWQHYLGAWVLSPIKENPALLEALFAFWTFWPAARPFPNPFYFHCFNQRTINQTLGFGSLFAFRACTVWWLWTIHGMMLCCEHFFALLPRQSTSPIPPSCPPSPNLAMLVTLHQDINVLIHKKNPIHVISFSLYELWGKGK